jgi:transglutaminase-like putative cysteine protease
MKIKTTLFRYDLTTARKNKQKELNDVDVNDYLRNERYIEKDDPQIQEIAKGIKDSDQMSIVRRLYDYVVDNIRYVDFHQELGAVETFRRKQGACTEYSDLFVALCRAKGIPARVVKGFVTEHVNSPTPKHAWAEVYLKEYGWVPFDPTYGDVAQQSVKDNRFENLKPIYIYLSSIRNDELMDKAITMTGIFVGDVQVNDSLEFR